MGNLYELYITYESEIATTLQSILIILAIAILIIAISIRKKLKKIIKQVNVYLNTIIEDEEEELQKKEVMKKRAIQDEQSKLISKVLEEIFP